jgi:DNA topoisomerase VI subunit B
MNNTRKICTKKASELHRQTFRTSRLLDFVSEKELVAQIGHPLAAWPMVLVKELLDNALDACEEASVAPKLVISVDDSGLTIIDNGPGIPADVVAALLDYSVRVSSREAYISPSRGAQGNALKTVVAMPFVINGDRGSVTIRSCGVRHEISLGVDRIQQKPMIDHKSEPDEEFVKNGTSITVHLPSSFFLGDEQDLQKSDDDDDDSSSSLADYRKQRFLQIADDFAFLNPHLSLTCDWFGEQELNIKAYDPAWAKWRPSDPTSAYWYGREHFERLVAAHLSHKTYDTIRELVAEFRGFSGSAKQKLVLDATGLHRSPLSALVNSDDKSFDSKHVVSLHNALKEHSKPVKPVALGVIGRQHLESRFSAMGCEMKSFDYRKVEGGTKGIPWIIEVAFAWCPSLWQRRMITGVNWSPGIINPFRELGNFGGSLDSILEQQRAGINEPIVLLLHLACPRVSFTDRGKSSVIVEN